MSAEGNLYNPALFDTRVPNPPHTDLALEYLDIVKSLKTPTSPGAIKGHLFKLFRPALDRNKDLRDRLGKTHGKPGDVLVEYEAVAGEMKERMEVSERELGVRLGFSNETCIAFSEILPTLQIVVHLRPKFFQMVDRRYLTGGRSHISDRDRLQRAILLLWRPPRIVSSN
jgi:hypothetical protein